MSWTHEEQTIIDQAVEDLTSLAPDLKIQEVQTKLQEALGFWKHQKSNALSLQSIRRVALEILDRAFDTKDSCNVVVERDPLDPSVVVVNVDYRPKFPISFIIGPK